MNRIVKLGLLIFLFIVEDNNRSIVGYESLQAVRKIIKLCENDKSSEKDQIYSYRD